LESIRRGVVGSFCSLFVNHRCIIFNRGGGRTMKEVIITPEKPVYSVLTDARLPVSVRGRIAYEDYKKAVRILIFHERGLN
jgi:hypothetical protein